MAIDVHADAASTAGRHRRRRARATRWREGRAVTTRHRGPRLARCQLAVFIACTRGAVHVRSARCRARHITFRPSAQTSDTSDHGRVQLRTPAAAVLDQARAALAGGRHPELRRRRLRGRRGRGDGAAAGQVRGRAGRRAVLQRGLPRARLQGRVAATGGRRGEAQQRARRQGAGGQGHGQVSPAAAGRAHGAQHPYAGQWRGHTGQALGGAGARAGLERPRGRHAQDHARLPARGEVRAARGRRRHAPPRPVTDGHAQGQPRVGRRQHHQGRAQGQAGRRLLHEDRGRVPPHRGGAGGRHGWRRHRHARQFRARTAQGHGRRAQEAVPAPAHRGQRRHHARDARPVRVAARGHREPGQADAGLPVPRLLAQDPEGRRRAGAVRRTSIAR